MTRNEQIASIMLEAAELLKNDPELGLLNEGAIDTIKKGVKILIEKIIHLCRQIKAWLQTKVKGDIVIDEDCENIDIDKALSMIDKINSSINDPDNIDISFDELLKNYKAGDKVNRNKIISIINRCEVITRKINSDNDEKYDKILRTIYNISKTILKLQKMTHLKIIQKKIIHQIFQKNL